MPESIKNKITYALGFDPTSNGVTVPVLNELALYSAKYIMDIVSSLYPDDFMFFSNTYEVTNSNGRALTGEKVIRVTRKSNTLTPPATYTIRLIARARIIKDSDISRLSDPTSIDYPSTNFPVAYISGSKIYILPAPDVNDIGYVTTVAYPTSIDTSQTSVTGIPGQYLEILALYTSIKVIIYLLGAAEVNLGLAVTNDDSERVQLYNAKIQAYTKKRGELEAQFAEFMKVRLGR
jgi:hypothetical protein